MGLFDSLFTNENARDASDAQARGLKNAYNEYSGLAGQGREALQTNFAAGLQPFQQNYATAGAGQNAYANATGANGPTGFAQAAQDFRQSPGLQFALDKGSENVMRNKAATGQLASGGTNIDLQNQGIGLGLQDWNNYVKNLLPFVGASGAAAQGIGTLNAGLGTALNTSFTGEGEKAYGTQAGIGNAQANADLANNQAAANQVAAIMQGTKLATQLAGFMG